MTTTIGPVSPTVSRQAEAFVLEAVRISDCSVDELVTSLCGSIRPPKVAARLTRLEMAILSAEYAIPRLAYLPDVFDARARLASLQHKHDELVNACRSAAYDLIQWLAAKEMVILDGDVVRAA